MNEKRNIKIVGKTEIPNGDERQWGKDLELSGQVIQLLEPGKAVLVEIEDDKTLERFRRSVCMAATRAFGSGRLSTAKNGKKLWVWLREDKDRPKMRVIGQDILLRGVFEA